MNKQEIFIPILIFILAILFAGICAAVFLTRGKSEKWIRRKMKIGAVLLTLNAFTPSSAQEIEVSCYDIAEENVFGLKGNKTELVFSQNQRFKIEAYVDFRTDQDYAYAIIDNNEKIIERGRINAIDGKFDKWKEDFEIKPKTKLKAGSYFLLFLEGKPEMIEPKRAKLRVKMIVK